MNNKVYFENEEEAKEFFDKTATVGNNSHQDKKRSFIFNCERFGYIKKSDLEIARENFNGVIRKNWEHLHKIANDDQFEYLDKSIKFIRALEKALEEK